MLLWTTLWTLSRKFNNTGIKLNIFTSSRREPTLWFLFSSLVVPRWVSVWRVPILHSRYGCCPHLPSLWDSHVLHQCTMRCTECVLQSKMWFSDHQCCFLCQNDWVHKCTGHKCLRNSLTMFLLARCTWSQSNSVRACLHQASASTLRSLRWH